MMMTVSIRKVKMMMMMRKYLNKRVDNPTRTPPCHIRWHGASGQK